MFPQGLSSFLLGFRAVTVVVIQSRICYASRETQQQMVAFSTWRLPRCTVTNH